MVVAAEDRSWEPFGVTDADFAAAPEHDGVRMVNVRLGGQGADGQAGWWLRCAAAALGVLAAAAAVVSWDAQYMMVRSVKHVAIVAALEAGIPDVGAVIFAALGVALALHGGRALRPRALNAACVGISLAMNALAAGRGWRDLAIWVMPAAVYAVASDTLIGVVRAWAIARQDGSQLAGEGPGLLATVGSGALWLLRLVLAPPSTLRGFRDWVVADCPVAPGRSPGHAAELAAVRQDAEQRLAITAHQHEEAVDRAIAQAREATEEAAQARSAEALARSELQEQRSEASRLAAQARADAARECEAVRTWAGQLAGEMRAELRRAQEEAAGWVTEIREAAGHRVAALEEARAELRHRAERAEEQASALRVDRDRMAAELHALPAPSLRARTAARPGARARQAGRRGPTKRDQMITLASQRHDMARLPQNEVAGLARTLAQEIGYSAGTARRELMAHVRGLQASGKETAGDE